MKPMTTLKVLASAAALLSFAAYGQNLPGDTDVDTPPVDNTVDETMDDTTIPRTGDDTAPEGDMGMGMEMDSRFGELDVDGSGSLSEDEVRGDADLRARFDDLDGDSDGMLTEQEFSVHSGG